MTTRQQPDAYAFRLISILILAAGPLHAVEYCPIWMYQTAWGTFYGPTPPVPVNANYAKYFASNPGNYSTTVTGCTVTGNFPAVGRYVESDPAGLSAGINTYSYAYNDPVETIDPSGLSAFKIIKLCAEGHKVVKEVGFKQAVQALRRGEDVLAPSTKQARKVANSASDAGGPIRDPAHNADYMKHYHPNLRTGGHVFYSVAAALTISHYVQCSDCVAADLATIGDFFNPLSLPQDAIDIYNTVTSP